SGRETIAREQQVSQRNGAEAETGLAEELPAGEGASVPKSGVQIHGFNLDQDSRRRAVLATAIKSRANSDRCWRRSKDSPGPALGNPRQRLGLRQPFAAFTPGEFRA